MKIKNIQKVGKREVYDISVEDVEHYVLENGVVSHNTAPTLFSQNVLILSKSQIKDGKDLIGYTYTVNVNKSRFSKEKSKLSFDLLYDENLNRYSGLLDLAIESGHVSKITSQSFSKVNVESGEVEGTKYKRSQTNTKQFWESILNDPKFDEYVKSKYQLNSTLISDEEIDSIDTSSYEDEDV